MAIGEQQRKILARIAEKTHSNVDEFVPDTSIIDDVGFPKEETRKYFHELQSLEMIHIDQRMSGTADEKGREYRMIGITKEGIKELATDDDESQHAL